MGTLVPIILYTRRDCSLCADAESIVDDFAARFPLRVEVRDVDADPMWRQSLGMEVPVVFLAEQKLFRYRIEPPAFEAAILAHLGTADNGDQT